MTLNDLAALAADVRKKQRRYFQKRDNFDDCVRAERALDAALEALEAGPTLFEQRPPERAGELRALAAKLLAAQSRTTDPAAYATPADASAAKHYADELHAVLRDLDALDAVPEQDPYEEAHHP